MLWSQHCLSVCMLAHLSGGTWPKVLQSCGMQVLEQCLKATALLWSIIILATTPDDCRAAQSLDTSLYITFSSIAHDYGQYCDKVKLRIPHLRYISCTPRSLLCAAPINGRCAMMFTEDQTFQCYLTCVVHSCCLTLAVSNLMCNLWILYVTHLAVWAGCTVQHESNSQAS